MIWWTGKGFVIAMLVALIFVSVSDGGEPTRGALSLVASAAIVFLLREWAGEESSVFSIPVRYWPPVLMFFAVLVYTGR